MADFLIAIREYRNPLVVSRQFFRAGIDIDHLDSEIMLAAQRLQRNEHVFAKMTVTPAVESQDRLTYPALP